MLKRRSELSNRVLGFGGALVLLTVGVASAHAGDDSSTRSAASDRATAALAATQKELADTELRVADIRHELNIEGREVYSLAGPASACILVAGEAQPAGRSELLVCTDQTTSDPTRPMRTGFETSGKGYVDLVWIADGPSPAVVKSNGTPTSIARGPRVVAAFRPDDSAAGALEWTAVDGRGVSVRLPPREERAALSRPGD